MNHLSESSETGAVRRCFVMKKQGRDPRGETLLQFIREQLHCDSIESVRTGICYDVVGYDEAQYARVQRTIFSEAPVDDCHSDETFAASAGANVILIQPLPGQYNQVADWAEQGSTLETGLSATIQTSECIQLLGSIPSPVIAALKKYLINPTDSREGSMKKPETLIDPIFDHIDVKVVDGFRRANREELLTIKTNCKLAALTLADMHEIQMEFGNEGRDPTVTELKNINVYWSDHCRHTTFTTALERFFIDGMAIGSHGEIEGEGVQNSMQRCVQDTMKMYLADRRSVHVDATDEPPTLMDLALLSMRRLRMLGKLDDVEHSEENNAASIIVPVKFEDGRMEEWLFMFKNETHNHPTEIEPYGGAATCIGGAIRDPLSGRAYVFMGMRISGSGDPRTPLDQTVSGRLPQRRITTGALAGFAGYGNQIGVPTQKVMEVYHEGYVAKRFECGFVGGAVKREDVCREVPVEGDIVILLGGRTGRDGCDAAAGSSSQQTETSIHTAGSEVQKGNPVTERKIQRLFRNPSVSRLIKRCNDFGAGGVTVAVGELADGLNIYLDEVPLKYLGLDGTEIATSESQERMAVVIRRSDVADFTRFAEEENLEATVVATVTNDSRMKMQWRGKTICDLRRAFLAGGWAKRTADVDMQMPKDFSFFSSLPDGIDPLSPLARQWEQNLQRLNVCSKRSMQQRFDSTVGANTIIQPYGGMYQSSPSEAAVVKFPVEGALTAVATSAGFDPELSSQSPFHGAVYAVVDAIARIVAAGGDAASVKLSLQNYFESLGNDSKRWGKPMLAQLGAYLAQSMLGVAAIGGKDSMSGSFTDATTGKRIDVPPTLVAFAVGVMESKRALQSSFQKPGHTIVHLTVPRDANDLPQWQILRDMWSRVTQHAGYGAIASAHAVHAGGVAAALTEMSFGNNTGAHLAHAPGSSTEWFTAQYGSMIVELSKHQDPSHLFQGLPYSVLGTTETTPNIRLNGGLSTTLWHADLARAYESPLESVFPSTPSREGSGAVHQHPSSMRRVPVRRSRKRINPRVSILTFPGTNCEYETAAAFKRAGSSCVDVPVFVNLNRKKILESLDHVAHSIARSHIVAIPGGFSAGDQPGGSGKFGAAVLRSPKVADALHDLVARDGLIIGICNGFQILLKSGLLSGTIGECSKDSPTLTDNDIATYFSTNVMHRVKSLLSPWMRFFAIDELADFPIAHGEGKIIQVPSSVWKNGQVPFQYADRDGIVADRFPANPNGSQENIAALTDPTGRVFGIMAHPERAIKGLGVNVPTQRNGQKIFDAAVDYFQ